MASGIISTVLLERFHGNTQMCTEFKHFSTIVYTIITLSVNESKQVNRSILGMRNKCRLNYGGREGHFCDSHSAKLIGTQPISRIRLARVLRISRSRFQYCALAKSSCTFREADSPVLHFPNPILILRTSQVRLFISRSGHTRSTFSKFNCENHEADTPVLHFPNSIAKIAKRTSIASLRGQGSLFASRAHARIGSSEPYRVLQYL